MKVSIDELVESRIIPNINYKSTTNNEVHYIKVRTNLECEVYIDGEERFVAKQDTLCKYPLSAGEYELKFISVENPIDQIVEKFIMPSNDKIYNIDLYSIRQRRLESTRREKEEIEKQKRAEKVSRKIYEKDRIAQEEYRKKYKEYKQAHKRLQKYFTGFGIGTIIIGLVFLCIRINLGYEEEDYPGWFGGMLCFLNILLGTIYIMVKGLPYEIETKIMETLAVVLIIYGFITLLSDDVWGSTISMFCVPLVGYFMYVFWNSE